MAAVVVLTVLPQAVLVALVAVALAQVTVTLEGQAQQTQVVAVVVAQVVTEHKQVEQVVLVWSL